MTKPTGVRQNGRICFDPPAILDGVPRGEPRPSPALYRPRRQTVRNAAEPLTGNGRVDRASNSGPERPLTTFPNNELVASTRPRRRGPLVEQSIG